MSGSPQPQDIVPLILKQPYCVGVRRATVAVESTSYEDDMCPSGLSLLLEDHLLPEGSSLSV